VVDGSGYIPKPRLGDSSIGQINGVLGTNADYAAANREVVVRFIKALMEINAYLTRNVDEHVKTAVGFMGIQPAIARKAIESFTYDDNIYMKQTRAYAKLVHQYGLTKADTSDQIQSAVDFSFLEAASGKNRKQLGDV
jgi:ABC-type nitrate/sulfonate/bicarbonate transport system substrate-binding protein